MHAAAPYRTLRKSRAQLLREAHLGDGLRVAQWRNQDDAVCYSACDHHTLSVYLAGGHGTRRVGHAQTGGPGRYCTLPAHEASAWQVQGPLQFIHLYVAPQAWAERVVRLLDAEPRAMPLPTRIYASDALVQRWSQILNACDWASASARLQAQLASHAVLDHLLLQAAQPRQREAALRAVRGGLAPATRRRVLEAIEAHLAQPAALSLAQLAQCAGLSEYHFARMFRTSMGCSVHGWITQRRVARARQWLACTDWALARIARECGWCSASHLARHLRAATGMTALQWRQAARAQG